MCPITRIVLAYDLPGGAIVSLRGPRGVKRLAPDYVAGHTGHHDIEFKVRGREQGSLLLVIETPKPAGVVDLSDMDMSLIRIEVRGVKPSPWARATAKEHRLPRIPVKDKLEGRWENADVPDGDGEER